MKAFEKRTFSSSVVSISLIATLLIGFGGCDTSSTATTAFHQGRNSLMQSNFKAADDQLAAFLKQYPNHTLASRAIFLRGKAAIGEGDFAAATQFFNQTIKLHPKSEEAHKARYKVAFVKLLTGERTGAMKAFESLRHDSPGTLVPEAVAFAKLLREQQALDQQASGKHPHRPQGEFAAEAADRE